MSSYQLNFSRSQTECLKGIFALGIVICHLCSRTGLGSSIGLGPIYTALGYWGVSIFLFISGYGLMCRYLAIRGGYFVNYMKNRILPIYCLNILLIIVYTLLKWFVGRDFTMQEFLLSFAFGDTIVQFGWYLQVCMLFYLLFYISFRWVKEPVAGILVNSCLTIGYCIICYLIDVSSTWYECSLSIIAGMAMAMLNTKVSENSKSKQLLFLVVAGTLFSISFILSGYKLFSSDLRLLLKVISSVSFAMTVYFACCFIPLKGKILEWLGNHYLEIYILQGVSIILADEYLGRDNSLLYFMTCFVGTMFLAACMKTPIRKFMTLIKK